mgnify:CR=1 FL=1
MSNRCSVCDYTVDGLSLCNVEETYNKRQMILTAWDEYLCEECNDFVQAITLEYSNIAEEEGTVEDEDQRLPECVVE